MTAAEILRRRAAYHDNTAAFFGLTHRVEVVKRHAKLAAELRAVAELMEAGYRRHHGGYSCRYCKGEWWDAAVLWTKPHAADCPLAALERLIEGERDGSA